MANMRTTERRSLGFRLFTLPFIFIIFLVLDMSILHADSALGLALSVTTCQAVFANVTSRNGSVPATPTETPLDSGAGTGDAS